MSEAVIVEAVRTPFLRRGGAFADVHPAHLLQQPIRELLTRAGIADSEVDQIAAGCVTQAGEQGGNIARTAWLDAGFDVATGASTIDCKCGSSQQANHTIAALIDAGAIDVGIACGVESMSRVPLGINILNGPGIWRPESFPWDGPDQFVAADRIAVRRGIERSDLDAFGALSQNRAARAWETGRFEREVMSVTPNSERMPLTTQPNGDAPAPRDSVPITRDSGLRDTSVEALAHLNAVQEGGLHTAGTSSQLTDGAAAVLWMSSRRARELGLTPRARIRAQALIGTDPYYLLDGPVDAGAMLAKRSGIALGEIDRFEINEALASVVLSFAKVHDIDLDRINVNGGAIALGHPVGATGSRLIGTMVHQLEMDDLELGMVAMCCGGALATATIIERLA